jgi:hypothetical protein
MSDAIEMNYRAALQLRRPAVDPLSDPPRSRALEHTATDRKRRLWRKVMARVGWPSSLLVSPRYSSSSRDTSVFSLVACEFACSCSMTSACQHYRAALWSETDENHGRHPPSQSTKPYNSSAPDKYLCSPNRMSSSEVSWQSAFWALPPLAINAMMQPAGRVCGYDLSLRTYLRSSPIVCVCDAVLILVRFALNYANVRCPFLAAKLVMATRKRGERAGEAGGFQYLETSNFLRWFVFILGVVPQTIKLLACKGIPWTTTWGLLYLSAFVVSEIMDILSRFSNDSNQEPPLQVDNIEELDERLRVVERAFGAIAIFLQLGVLALVDLAVLPPDQIVRRRWEFRIIRLTGHFVTIFIYSPFVLSERDDPVRALERRNQSVVISTLCVFIVITVLHGLNYRFSQMYFLWSFMISMLAWVLHSFKSTRKHILLCRDHGLGTKNVLAFDFCSRILVFGVFWYVWYYNANDTSKPRWTEYLG